MFCFYVLLNENVMLVNFVEDTINYLEKNKIIFQAIFGYYIQITQVFPKASILIGGSLKSLLLLKIVLKSLFLRFENLNL